MFTGLDEIDWASMRHAYGPAREAPEVVRGLVDRRKRVRSWAQDCMWGGIHHQGDVYACTLATVPFLLEAAAMPDVRGRAAVLKLLASIGGAEVEDDDPLRRAARLAVSRGFPTFVSLLADRRRSVRRAVPDVLLVSREHAADTVSLLRERLTVERKASVRVAIVAALGTIARRARAGEADGVDAADLAAWIAGQVSASKHADVRMAALAEHLRLTDGTGGDLASTLYAMVTETDAIDLRDLREALGDRVAVRNDLLARIVREGPDDRRATAMWAASGAMSRWRGDYGDLMLAFAELLPRDRTRRIGLHLLTNDAWPLAAPAADHISRFIESSPTVFVDEPPGLWSVTGGPAWALNTTLARLGDPRALPLIRRALEEDLLPVDCRPPLRAYGADGAPFVPLLRRQIQRAIAAGALEEAQELLWNLTFVGPAAAEALPEVVTLLPQRSLFRVPLRALAAMGPAARPAAPLVRDLLAADPETTATAATALGAIEGAAAEADLRPLLTHDEPAVRTAAADALRAVGVPAAEVLPAYDHTDLKALGEIGPDAAPMVPRLRAALESARWPEMILATLWRITGDTAAALPALAENWRRKRDRNDWTVRCWTDMGPAAAGAEPLLCQELADPVRVTYQPNTWGSADIEDDERYVAECRAALEAVTSAAAPDDDPQPR
ncbi:HEAT repeat domain-containing protein [Virgisporangium ochraceum]|uniref:HEAT repeat domain-containing protein n=1 Tax=Virgisporangium ochraceum TaxID=65505 RepID=UPI001942B46D|nr:HEAT repeat domain-containing protein [Virgisporangium ochraceum]